VRNMQEHYGKYEATTRVTTNPLIDDPAIIFLGRTLNELLLSAGIFVISGVFMEAPLFGAIGALVVGWIVPAYRMHFSRGYAVHLAWALGVHRPRGLACGRIFSPTKPTSRFGP